MRNRKRKKERKNERKIKDEFSLILIKEMHGRRNKEVLKVKRKCFPFSLQFFFRYFVGTYPLIYYQDLASISFFFTFARFTLALYPPHPLLLLLPSIFLPRITFYHLFQIQRDFKTFSVSSNSPPSIPPQCYPQISVSYNRSLQAIMRRSKKNLAKIKEGKSTNLCSSGGVNNITTEVILGIISVGS